MLSPNRPYTFAIPDHQRKEEYEVKRGRREEACFCSNQHQALKKHYLQESEEIIPRKSFLASADEKPLCIGSNTNRKRTPTLHIQHGISVKRAILAIVTSSVYKKVVIFHATKTTCKLCDDTFQIKGAVVTPIKYAMNHNLKLNKRNYQQNHLSFVTYTAFLYISNKNPD